MLLILFDPLELVMLGPLVIAALDSVCGAR